MNKRYCLAESELNLYASNDLEPLEMQRATKHLADCARCRNEVSAIREMLAVLPNFDLQLSEAEKRRFSARVVQAAQRKQSTFKLLPWATAATAVTAGLLALMINSPGNQTALQPSTRSHLAELELVENLDLLEAMDLLEVMELLEQLEDRG